MDPPKQFNRSTYFTVAGERRQMEIPMPCSLLGSKPGEVLNKHVSGLHTSFFLLVAAAHLEAMSGKRTQCLVSPLVHLHLELKVSNWYVIEKQYFATHCKFQSYVSLTKHAALASCMIETTTPHTYITKHHILETFLLTFISFTSC